MHVEGKNKLKSQNYASRLKHKASIFKTFCCYHFGYPSVRKQMQYDSFCVCEMNLQ
jgi:hypothetical protein